MTTEWEAPNPTCSSCAAPLLSPLSIERGLCARCQPSHYSWAESRWVDGPGDSDSAT